MTESPADPARPGYPLTLRPGLPPVWAGRRRRYLAMLVLAGLGQATAAGVGAHVLSRALTRAGSGSAAPLLGLVVVTALLVGLLRMAERVLSEQLSQHYVHEIRMGLLRRNLLDGIVNSLGIAIARTTNDLTSVKNWVSQGVAPLAVGIPLIVGSGVALCLLDPLLAVGLVVPIALLAAALRALSPVAYRRARHTRRQRGRLSSHIADLILATPAIRSGGGSVRELNRIEKDSDALVSASIKKATVAGAIRGAAAATVGFVTATVIGAGLLGGLPTHVLAGALMIVGFLATPLNDLGKVVEYRQTYRAARRILGPAIEPAPAVNAVHVDPARPPADAREGVRVTSVTLSDGTVMANLVARPGERIVVDAGGPRLDSEALDQLAGLRSTAPGAVKVSGRDLSMASPKELRRLVGYGARGMRLASGSVSRTVRYRAPNTDPTEVGRYLRPVGLAHRVARLPKGEDTILTHGGEPLSVPERARLILARAMLDDPPLLVFDHLDADLGPDGRVMMRTVLAGYPGVVILSTDYPDQLAGTVRRWHPTRPQSSGLGLRGDSRPIASVFDDGE